MVEISEEEDDDVSKNNNNNKSFKYVFIPCDETQPIEEKLLDIPPGRDMECLLDALKKHFLESGMQSMEDTSVTKDQ